MTVIPTPPQAAMAELTRRRDIAQQAVDEGRWSRRSAEAALRPWVAIALRAGCHIPPLREALADEADRARKSWSDFDDARIYSVSRALLADEMSRRDEWSAVLMSAREKALNRFTEATAPSESETDRAIALTILCNHFRLPGWRPPVMVDVSERNAA